MLAFLVDDARYALPAATVREVVRAVAIQPLPKAPEFVDGVVNFRGTIVPVLDVRRRCRRPAAPLHPDQHFIMAWAGPRLVALRVDRALDVVSVDARDVENASRSTPGTELVAGIAKLPDGVLVIHDLARFLALDEAAQLDRTLAARAAEQP